MILVDSHAHLTFPDFAEDVVGVMTRAREAGVVTVHSIATHLVEAPLLSQLCGVHPGLVASAGVHPHHASKEPVTFEALMAACSLPGMVGVGETGFDYHYQFSSREDQERLFRLHIQVARALGLPLIIHCREAEEDTRRVLAEEGASFCGGVLHCFTGTPEMADWAMANGFHLSFSGVLTFRNAEALRQLARRLPLDRLLVETDSPYLAPVPHRGQRNEPAYVARVAATLAQARGITVEEVAQATTANFQRLFQPPVPRQPVLAYPIGRGLYLNVTRGCTQRCTFCPKWDRPLVHDYDLTLSRNPTAAELIDAMGDISGYDEVVFCGYGEPTLRLGVILEVATAVKRRGGRVRLNTDGLANLVYRTDVTPRFAGLIDAVSVSLNAQDEATYNRICRPSLPGAFTGVQEFIRLVGRHVPRVVATAIDGVPGVDVAACRALALKLGAGFRAREFNRLG